MQHRHLQLQVIGGMQGENREQRQRVMMLLYNLEAPPCMTGNALSFYYLCKDADKSSNLRYCRQQPQF
jgi:hypothetical protein